MSVHYTAGRVTVHHGDALAVLRQLPDESVHAVVTDPPYGLADLPTKVVVKALVAWLEGDREHVPDGKGFMGAAWDAFVPPPALWDECYRVLKPGGHVLAFAGSRTHDLMSTSIRLAGFDKRDSIAWLYGSGFPKSLDVSKAIDKAAGAQRTVIGKHPAPAGNKAGGASLNMSVVGMPESADVTLPATPAAQQWSGWGTALKPSHEPIIVARKPLQGTVAANVLEWGCGAINVAACRVGSPSGSTEGGVREARTGRCPVHGLPNLRATHAEASVGRGTGETSSDVQPRVPFGDDVQASESSVQRRGLDREQVGLSEDEHGAHVAGGLGAPAFTTPARGVRAPNGHGAEDRATSASVRDGASHQRRQGRQSPGEPAPNRLGRALPGAPADRAGTDSASSGERAAAGCTCGTDAGVTPAGRWPANVVLDEHAAAQLDDQTGYQRDGVAVNRNRPPGGTDYSSTAAAYAFRGQAGPDVTYGGGGGGSRFFPVFRYCPKAPARERPSYERKGAPEPVHHRSASYRCITCGRQAVNVPGSACACPDPQLAPDPAKAGRVVHPTVKPLTLISWLVRLVTPPGGVVLEPFAGSGTTVEACLLEGFGCVAVEADAEYLPLIDQRIARANATLAARPQPDLFGGGAA